MKIIPFSLHAGTTVHKKSILAKKLPYFTVFILPVENETIQTSVKNLQHNDTFVSFK